MGLQGLKKGIFICASIAVITLILCLLQYAVHYYSHPLEEKVSFTTTGCLIFGSNDSEMESVPIEVYGKNLHYIYRNNPEAIQGDIFVNGLNIFGHDRKRNAEGFGFYTQFREKDFATVEVEGDGIDGRIISVSKDFQTIICGVNISPEISDSGKTGQKGQAMLIIPETDWESAKEIIRNASLNAEQLNAWLEENGWKF